MTTPTAQPTDIVHRGFDALNERNREAFLDVHAADVVLHDNDETVRGVDAVVDHEWTFYDAFPDMHYTIQETVAEGDTIACRWTAAGTHDGTFEGIPPTGEDVEIQAGGLFQVADGQIAEIWLITDRLDLLQQLGAVDPPTD